LAPVWRTSCKTWHPVRLGWNCLAACVREDRMNCIESIQWFTSKLLDSQGVDILLANLRRG
jgi:hypothetical protein